MLAVPVEGLDACATQRLRVTVPAPEHARHSAHLHGIRKEAACAVALHAVDVEAGERRGAEAVADELLQRGRVGRVHGDVPAVVVHGGARDDAQQGLAFPLQQELVLHDLRHLLNHQAAAAVPMTPALHRGVEGRAAARLGQHAGRLLLRPVVHGHVDLDPAAQGEVVHLAAALLLESLATQVHGDQPRSILGIYSHTRSLHAEAEAEAVRRDGRRAARGPERALGARVRGPLHEAEVGAAGGVAGVHAAQGAHDLPLLQPCAKERLVAALQDDALLRVHDL
mmetsp:Transcript_61872/g.180835  ORF Transcript_61872/g.180835 Transcript_61872/m.180835 type:complete len:282 (+) Transcript_61872:1790-2635(+)